MSGYEWVSCSSGDSLPRGAVMAGSSSSDGVNFVCRVEGEAGKVNMDGDSINNFWCHDGGKSQSGDVLCTAEGSIARWEYKSRGDSLPEGAVLAGSTSGDGDNYVCRNAGAAGKVNLDDGHIHNFWIHGNWFAKGDGDVLVVEACAGDGGGSEPAPAPQPEPAPQPWHPPQHEDHAYKNWNPDADCGGARAEDRVSWLMENQGMSREDAEREVMREFPFVFREGYGRDWWQPGADCDGSSAEDRANWLMQNEGFSQHAARLKVKSEFPGNFSGGGDFVSCNKFPHALSLVDTEAGPRLKLEVVCNHENVALVAVHYQVNGGAPMNFDVREPDEGSRTYTHVTPHGGGYPLCRDGDQVTYWLAAEIDGLIQEEPEGACPNPEARMQWTAHH